MRLISLASSSTALLTLAACGVLGGGNRVVGTGPLITDNRRLTAIEEVSLDAAVDLVIVQGEEQTVNVTAQSEVQPILLTEVDGGKLTIDIDGNVDMDGGTNVELVIPTLEQLTLNSSGNVSVRGFGGDKLELSSSGSGNLAASNLDYDDIELSTSGSGDVDLGGRADNLAIQLTASGDVEAFDLSADDASVTSKGSGDVRLTVSNELDAEVKGSGSIYYRGNPELKIKDDGSGSVESVD